MHKLRRGHVLVVDGRNVLDHMQELRSGLVLSCDESGVLNDLCRVPCGHLRSGLRQQRSHGVHELCSGPILCTDRRHILGHVHELCGRSILSDRRRSAFIHLYKLPCGPVSFHHGSRSVNELRCLPNRDLLVGDRCIGLHDMRKLCGGAVFDSHGRNDIVGLHGLRCGQVRELLGDRGCVHELRGGPVFNQHGRSCVIYVRELWSRQVLDNHWCGGVINLQRLPCWKISLHDWSHRLNELCELPRRHLLNSSRWSDFVNGVRELCGWAVLGGHRCHAVVRVLGVYRRHVPEHSGGGHLRRVHELRRGPVLDEDGCNGF
jgi:hypothetical protein